MKSFRTFFAFYSSPDDYYDIVPEFYRAVSSFSLETNSEKIPNWIRNNAGWWATDQISDSEFVTGIEFLIKNGIIEIEYDSTGNPEEKTIPSWIKQNAGWWYEEKISDDEFLKGIQFLVENGIIKV